MCGVVPERGVEGRECSTQRQWSLSPEEGESLVLCLKNPEEACVALLLPSYITV